MNEPRSGGREGRRQPGETLVLFLDVSSKWIEIHTH